ncbi:twin-arginine translocase subunit TatC [Fictibacillus enclensis]|uniref:twin-arginine translocase subunit TatC n=1 Tax=Fictibacillus enclensis TaxID=1017270 RepID=UPI0025A0F683|nr:twin-arginine translocase subunit TatC [Fictibacillus enclensis]MDM5198986.1 twin-arginine translocase subunit TatC [Fictibacillus enclensis]
MDEMSLVDHLTDLRKGILRVLVVLILSMIVGFIGAEPILEYLKTAEPASQITWNVFSPWDAISMYMKFAFIIGLVLTIPMILFQIWSFVRPGLLPIEQKAALLYIPFAVLLFLTGLAFAYFVIFPLAFNFTSGITRNLEFTETYGISQYFSFMFNILLPMSLLFELPVVVMFLTKIRLFNPLRLRKARKFAYFGLIMTATLVTPPDVTSDILVSIPLLLLYEISVLLSSWIYRKQLAENMACEEEYGGSLSQ